MTRLAGMPYLRRERRPGPTERNGTRVTRRWAIGAAVATALAAGSGYGAMASTAAGQPVDESVTVCGTGTMGQDVQEGASNQDHPTSSAFTGNEEAAGTQCTGDNSSAGSDMWTIAHSNVDVVTERGTEHGIFQRSNGAPPAGFNGHITDYDHQSGGDPCTDSAGRTVYYQSGTETDCAPSFGPVGNFNTHGGAATGTHFRGKYGTIIFQQGTATSDPTSNCQVGSQTYCIQIDLIGQTN